MLDLDSQYLCDAALADFLAKQEYQNRPKHILQILSKIFCNNSVEGDAEGEITKLASSQTAVQHSIGVDLVPNQLSASFIAGLCLLDLASCKHWQRQVLLEDDNLKVSSM